MPILNLSEAPFHAVVNLSFGLLLLFKFIQAHCDAPRAASSSTGSMVTVQTSLLWCHPQCNPSLSNFSWQPQNAKCSVEFYKIVTFETSVEWRLRITHPNGSPLKQSMFRQSRKEKTSQELFDICVQFQSEVADYTPHWWYEKQCLSCRTNWHHLADFPGN